MTSWFGFGGGAGGGGKKQPPKGNAPKGKSPAKGQPPKNQPKNQPKKEPQKVGKTGAKDQPKGGQPAAAAKGAPIRRTKSTDSSFLMKGVNTKEHFGSRLSSVNGSPTGESMFDVCAYVILCPKHSKILVSREEKSKYVWLPFVYLPTQRTWNDGAIDGANIILANGDAQAFVALQSKPAIAEATAMQMFRLQLPQTQKFNIRLIYFVKLSDKSDFKCCADTSRLKWMNAQDVQRGKIDNLWGPEIADFSQKISAAIVHTINEYSLDEALTYVPRDPPRNLEEEMLKSTNYTEKDVERLYSDFVEHCFPSFFMTQTSFNDYMSKYGFEKADKKLELLFRAFNFHKNSFLGFHEFLLGLTSIDPMASNGQSRIKFIFKYFDVDSDGYLNEKEFTTMVREIYPKDSNSVIKQKATESMKMIGTKGSKGVFFEDFFRAVGAHKFRGTHSLCRSNRPILAQISRSMASRTLKRSSDKKLKLESILKDRKYKGICQSCREKKYEYAKHTVRINAEGWCDQPKKLPEYEQLKKTKGSDESVDKEAKDADKESPDKESKSERKSLRKGSKDDSNNSTDSKKESAGGSKKESASTDVVWNHKSVANYFIEAIRAFNLKKGSHKDNKGLFDGSAEKEDFVKKLEYLCSAVEKLAMNEPRCVPMSSPAFIVGDIHGNLEDLLTLEKVLWRSAPIMAANFVFLGDYVDRGM
jgi:Ca2+-binding EF-hand superfamily protein